MEVRFALFHGGGEGETLGTCFFRTPGRTVCVRLVPTTVFLPDIILYYSVDPMLLTLNAMKSFLSLLYSQCSHLNVLTK